MKVHAQLHATSNRLSPRPGFASLVDAAHRQERHEASSDLCREGAASLLDLEVLAHLAVRKKRTDDNPRSAQGPICTASMHVASKFYTLDAAKPSLSESIHFMAPLQPG